MPVVGKAVVGIPGSGMLVYIGAQCTPYSVPVALLLRVIQQRRPSHTFKATGGAASFSARPLPATPRTASSRWNNDIDI